MNGSVPGSICTLEEGLCGWSNTGPDRNILDWDITSSQAESHYHVPSHDHTLGTERGRAATGEGAREGGREMLLILCCHCTGHFLFFPSSSRTPSNQNARLLSTHLPQTKGTCLRFWAHRPSSGNQATHRRAHTRNKRKQIHTHSELLFLLRPSGQHAGCVASDGGEPAARTAEGGRGGGHLGPLQC